MLGKWQVGEIRRLLNFEFPDLNELLEEEHPMTAVGVVLASAAVMATTDIEELVDFTGYSESFISAIAFNMKWNEIWSGNQYHAIELSRWFSPAHLVIDKKPYGNRSR